MPLNYRLDRRAVVASTMDEARRLAEQGAPEGTAVVADAQTAGRGRAGHAWYSPPGQSIHLSIVLRPGLAPPDAGWVTMAAALAVCDALSPLQPAVPRIKWFNDILLDGRKVCGILAETSITGGALDYAILGIGLNVNTVFDGAPEDVRARATSLRQAAGRPVDRDAVLRVVLDQFGARYERLLREGSSPAGEYARRLETLGRRVTIDAGGAPVTGVADRVNPDGSLVVRGETGERVARAGEVEDSNA